MKKLRSIIIKPAAYKDDEDQLLTIDEAAEFIKVRVSALYFKVSRY